MPTNTQTVSNYLDFALLQLGAESYLHGLEAIPADQLRNATVERWKFGINDASHSFIQRVATAGADTETLPGYNRMVGTQAAELFDKYLIIDHHANDATGFSATLFGKRGANGTIESYVWSMRSTEFRPEKIAGDRSRDQDGANLEILQKGFAFGQLASMQDYWSHIRNGERWAPSSGAGGGAWVADAKLTKFKDDLDSGKAFYTTGYSLSGNLATAFTLMHESEVTKAYLFNAAGTGLMSNPDDSIASMLALFSQALRDPANTPHGLDQFNNPNFGQLNALWLAAQNRQSADPAFNPFATENGKQSGRVNDYKDARYAYALALAQEYYPTQSLAKMGLLTLFGLVGGAISGWASGDFDTLGNRLQTAAGSQKVSGPGYDKIVQLFGAATHDDYQIVANSQRHTANEVGVFIEDQPDVYGNGGLLPGQVKAVTDATLANPNLPQGDFGTSHSIEQKKGVRS